MTIDERPFIYTDHQSFIELFETQAAQYHDRVFIRYQSHDNKPEFKALTYGQFNSIANYLADNWAQQLKNVQCVAFFSDETVQILLALIAVFKLGRTFFPISTRNSKEACLRLLKSTNTQYLIVSEEYEQIAQTNLKEMPSTQIKVWESFDVERLMTLASKYDNNANQFNRPTSTLSDIVLIIQSSGSTGFPKPLRLNNHYMIVSIRMLAEKKKTSPEEPYLESTDTLLGTLPAFHGSAHFAYWVPITVGGQVLTFREASPNPRTVISAAAEHNATVMVTAPYHLEAIERYLRANGSNETTKTVLEQFKFCVYFGAALPLEVGNFLHSQGLNVRSGYGSTELNFFAVANFSRDNQHWIVLKPLDILSKYCRWVHFSDDLYHLTVRGDCPTLNSDVGTDGYYETSDLFREEPPNSGYWHLVRRTSDIITLSVGGKIDPITIENEIRRASTVVSRCMVVGNYKSRTGVLIELNPKHASDYQSYDQIETEVYEAVRAANKVAPFTQSTIAVPEMIYILPPDRKLPITPKDTIARKEALEQFEKEISGMYDRFEE